MADTNEKHGNYLIFYVLQLLFASNLFGTPIKFLMAIACYRKVNRAHSTAFTIC